MSASTDYTFQTLSVTTPAEFVKNVELNRPEKRNAMNVTFWAEMVECFNKLAVDQDCRVIILSGAGKMFTSGLDVNDSGVFQKIQEDDPGRRAFFISKMVSQYQKSFSVIEQCHKPVLAAIHSACIGGGIDMISACDIRYSTQDAWFAIKEVDLGLAADVGTLQRFQKIIGNDSLFRELAYTGRRFNSDEAKSMGFVSRVLLDKNEMMVAALEVAKVIASKSPIAVQGSKHNIVYSRDHNVQASLDYMATWNSTMLQSEDVLKAITAAMQKQTPEFSKL
uniref:Delta(3,5)-Delta(2,4)-dienoyl-CoA isomerase, mitochondrial n=2 Tax=Arion vulgaris TaxID=1028688 RepID=A0A0B7BF52_9EUPU